MQRSLLLSRKKSRTVPPQRNFNFRSSAVWPSGSQVSRPEVTVVHGLLVDGATRWTWSGPHALRRPLHAAWWEGSLSRLPSNVPFQQENSHLSPNFFQFTVCQRGPHAPSLPLICVLTWNICLTCASFHKQLHRRAGRSNCGSRQIFVDADGVNGQCRCRETDDILWLKTGKCYSLFSRVNFNRWNVKSFSLNF